MAYSIKIVVSLLPVVLFFLYYLRNFIFARDVLHLAQGLFFGMLMSAGALIVQQLLPPTPSPLLRAFFHAGVVEESLRYAIILMFVLRSDETFTATEGIFRGLLVGLGFAFAENLHYAVNYSGFVILLRTVSSVPMHVFMSGIMGYYLAYAHHCRLPEIQDSTGRRRIATLMTLAFVIPLTYHTLFDYILFVGGRAQQLLPLLLTAGFLQLEYLSARARLIVPRNVLSVLGVDADDMEIITRQRHYEEWLKDRQSVRRTPVTLFRGRFSIANLVSGLLLLAMGAAGLALLLRAPHLLRLDPSLSFDVLLALCVGLPGTAGAVLLLADRLNYLYFRENLLRLPRVAWTNLRRGDQEFDTVTLDILPQGIFAADIHAFERKTNVMLELRGRGGKNARVPGIIRWTNAGEPNLPRGSVVRYRWRSPRFLWYLTAHRMGRFANGLRLLLAAQPGTTPGSQRPAAPNNKPKATPAAGPPASTNQTPATPTDPLASSATFDGSKTTLRTVAVAFPAALIRANQISDLLDELNRRTAPGAGDVEPVRFVADQNDHSPDYLRARENDEILLEVRITPERILAVEVPGFGSPRDASESAEPILGTQLYWIERDAASSVSGIGCAVIESPTEIIAELLLAKV